ncbi:MAG: SUF system NifU family Fe-S cluster assembly protein [Chloroflexi bacterium]|nr:SUF system NifU family Fe-S cluster assembly protein [Chloroflexota bacterium]
MSEPGLPLDDLYREVIIDHYRKPRNRGTIDGARHVEGVNPVCGDEIRMDVVIEDHTVKDIAFEGAGCSISQSSASMMTEEVKGRTLGEVEAKIAHFRAMMLDGAEPAADLGDLEALQGVTKFPVRVKCAMLSWNVLQEGLEPSTTPA